MITQKKIRLSTQTIATFAPQTTPRQNTKRKDCTKPHPETISKEVKYDEQTHFIACDSPISTSTHVKCKVNHKHNQRFFWFWKNTGGRKTTHIDDTFHFFSFLQTFIVVVFSEPIIAQIPNRNETIKLTLPKSSHLLFRNELR